MYDEMLPSYAGALEMDTPHSPGPWPDGSPHSPPVEMTQSQAFPLCLFLLAATTPTTTATNTSGTTIPVR